MRYVKLGRTGLEVSPICLGCMGFGASTLDRHAWKLGEDESRVIIRHALESGINFLDTANVYSRGVSEEIVGRALRDFARRDEIVLATKVHGAMREGPNAAGLSRKSIMTELDASLRRLGTDYIDLYQIHRWDPDTPIEETLQALDDAVRAGKVRYIGASSMFAWQFAKALHLADRRGWTRFVTMQNHYNLLYREEEREMLPLCADEMIGTLAWSPLAQGVLARPWGGETLRPAEDVFGNRPIGEVDRPVVEATHRTAAQLGVPAARVALAWLLGRPTVSAAIVGATRARYLDEAIAALDLTLSEQDRAELEQPYRPHAVIGHR